MADIRFGNFKPDSAGIQEIFKGAGMQAALREVVSSKASEATSIGHLHRTDKQPRYEGIVKVLDHTAVGVIKAANASATIDNHYHKTLDAINH